jgi:hypothetical protein
VLSCCAPRLGGSHARCDGTWHVTPPATGYRSSLLVVVVRFLPQHFPLWDSLDRLSPSSVPLHHIGIVPVSSILCIRGSHIILIAVVMHIWRLYQFSETGLSRVRVVVEYYRHTGFAHAWMIRIPGGNLILLNWGHSKLARLERLII